MASQQTAPAEPQGSFVGDLLGMFNFYIDPQASAKLITHTWFWIGPLIVISVILLVTSLQLLPVVQHVMENTPPPQGATPEQYQNGIAIGMTIQKVIAFLSPIVIAIITAIVAAVLLGTCAVMQIKAKFIWLFNLLMGAGLISALERIATVAIIKLKGEINTMAELQPPLGLDIFLPETTNKYLMAVVGFFSVFQIWYIVMLVLVFAAAFKVSKGKAFAAVCPILIIMLLLKMLGAVFQR
jgi:hypothetical protein